MCKPFYEMEMSVTLPSLVPGRVWILLARPVPGVAVQLVTIDYIQVGPKKKRSMSAPIARSSTHLRLFVALLQASSLTFQDYTRHGPMTGRHGRSATRATRIDSSIIIDAL